MMNAPSGQEHVVKKSKFTDEQIAFALKQAELGTRVEEVCRKMGISEATFYSLEEALRRCRSFRAAPLAPAGGRKPQA